ncbi:hypothetical protein KDL01_23395 [Actinospica durhamensis]|uniref:Uncharacterized protein n=1 Tax=Actinospica durhamensis TaxID=1508375 RepID=A0A941ES93_9ACTN|nr:hypothetical protein [Actinospica durhamensis]MBR7836243.1 hypothetical protein [Actinospica durhamensis]
MSVEPVQNEPIRRYDAGPQPLGQTRAARPGLPRPGHGAVFMYCDRHGNWSANWADDYPEPDSAGARHGIVYFEGEGTYDEVETWARAQPAQAWYVAYPACAVPGCPPDKMIGYQPLPPIS